MLGGLRTPVTNIKTNNFTGISAYSQPNPLFIIMFYYKRPDFITFDDQSPSRFF